MTLRSFRISISRILSSPLFLNSESKHCISFSNYSLVFFTVIPQLVSGSIRTFPRILALVNLFFSILFICFIIWYLVYRYRNHYFFSNLIGNYILFYESDAHADRNVIRSEMEKQIEWKRYPNGAKWLVVDNKNKTVRSSIWYHICSSNQQFP